MPIVVGKLTPQQVAPFGQLLNMYADAAEARDRYNATRADAQGLLFVTDDDAIEAAVVYREQDGDVTLISALGWKAIDRLALFEQLITYFSKQRVKSLTIKVAPNQTNSPLLAGFNRVA